MKKKFLLVSAFVVIAMSAMFVSCKNDDNNQSNNSNLCTCTNGQETHYVNPASEGVSSCAALNAIAVDGVRCW